jgi:hypothetical protein
LPFQNYLIDKSKDYGFRVITNPTTLGIHTDGVYLQKKNFNSLEIGSTEVGKFMHSEKDSLENVDTNLMGRLCEFIIELSNYWNP